MGLLVEEKDIVVPGEKLAEGMDFLPSEGAFREGEYIYAGKLGLIYVSGRLIKVIPLRGRYLPKKGDTIIGRVNDIGFSGWRIDFGWPFFGNISMKDGSRDFIERGADLSQYYALGDYIVGKIINISGPKIIDITMNGPGLRKLREGRFIQVVSSKVPRIIGKQGSMISLIKENTNCQIIVGQNGTVWVNCDNPEKEILAIETVRIIEGKSHTSGLTDKIKEFLEKS